jgi:ATP-dependent exoDNAse (exonuclease V) beta subunit
LTWKKKDTGIDWADFGTRMHAVLERMDFQNDLEEDLEVLIERSFLGLPQYHVEEARKILFQFKKTSLYQKIQNSKKVYRELPFVLHERHGVIHGIIDVLFLDEKGWHVLDYKTAVGDENKLKKNRGI